jgi:hypothetical protein
MSLAGYRAKTGFAPKTAYSWQVPGKNVAVSIDFDVVDRLSREIRRGSEAGTGSIVEVGGILLGTLDPGAGLAVTIEDFEPVPCEYAAEPHFLGVEADEKVFERALNRWRRGESQQLRPVGFYRSNCRNDLKLSSSDRGLMVRYFAGGEGVALLVAPRVRKPPQAALFFAEDGEYLTDYSYREFPLRRQELGGGEQEDELEAPVSGDSIMQRSAEKTGGSNSLGLKSDAGSERGQMPQLATTDTTAVPARTLRLRGGWVWLPLSFVFLLVGTVLGFQVALSVRSKVSNTPNINPYELNLTATPSAESVHLRWDRGSPALQNAQRGRLVIEEDGQIKNVSLDAGHLRNGSVIYRQAGNDVSFRLEVFLKERVSLSQTVEFRPVTAEPEIAQDGD